MVSTLRTIQYTPWPYCSPLIFCFLSTLLFLHFCLNPLTLLSFAVLVYFRGSFLFFLVNILSLHHGVCWPTPIAWVTSFHPAFHPDLLTTFIPRLVETFAPPIREFYLLRPSRDEDLLTGLHHTRFFSLLEETSPSWRALILALPRMLSPLSLRSPHISNPIPISRLT